MVNGTNSGTASWATCNYYGIRRISSGRLLPLARPFGSVTAAWNWADGMNYDLDNLETVNLIRDTEARDAYRAQGMKGLPR